MRAAWIKTSFALFLLVLIAAVSARTLVAQGAQQPEAKSGATADKQLPAEVAIEYSYEHSNAPPASCTCFNLNGGSATFSWTLKPGTVPGNFALVGDITSAHADGIGASSLDLTLSTFTAGVRYLPPTGKSPLQPFGQVLLGVAHAGGRLAQPPNPGAANAGAAFAANLGGGVDLRLNQRFSYRLAEAEYLVTTFDNGSNNHQNNLKISTGIVIHFR
jgi:peptidoglycan-associated lipoprotein